MRMADPSGSGTRPAIRPYRMRRRLESVEQTRARIVAATFDLHATIGPSRTSIRAIAARAGVQRHTVYAHFPDLDALYAACTEHGMAATAMPHPDDWSVIADPGERLRHGLTTMLAWYRDNGAMLDNVLFDIDPTAAAPGTPDPFEVRMVALLAALRDGRDVTAHRRATFDAVLEHALAYTTWRSLAEGGLTDSAIVAILVGLVEAVADGSIGE